MTTIEELEELRTNAQEALKKGALLQKELKQSIDEIQQEIYALELHKKKNICLRRILYPNMLIINADKDLCDLLKELYNQLKSKTDKYASLLVHKKDLRSTIALYSTQILDLRKKGRQEEKKERTSFFQKQESRKKEKCRQSNSKHPLSGNRFFALLPS
jgi:anion-transporting  ArsA/GET3 family ATPase